MKIIGLLGYKRVGKSTAAAYLESKGYQRHNMKDGLVRELKERFPDLLKEIVLSECEMGKGRELNKPVSEMIDDLFNTKPPLVRALMQNYGTEVRRAEDPDHWVHQWLNNLPEGLVVCDDVRFHNEADAIKSMGGTLIRITRDDITDGGSHSSETETNGIAHDYEVKSVKGDLEGLYEQINQILQ